MEEVEEEIIHKKPTYQSYFNYSHDNNLGKIATCSLCAERNLKKEIKMKNSNTSGLKYHLSRCHPNEHDLLFGEKKNELQKQKTLDSYTVKKNNSSWERRVAVFISRKKLTFNFFDDDDTQEFFTQLNPTVTYPRRNSLKNIVVDEFLLMKNNLKQILAKNRSKFSFTTDGWTAPNGRSYYGVTVHFIDDDWNCISLALDLVPSKGQHTGRAISTFFYGSVREYGIEGKIQGITLDNAAANTTFISELKCLLEEKNIDFDAEDQHFRCFPHIINLAVQDIVKLLDVEFDENVNYDYEKESSEEREHEETLYENDDDDDNNIDDFQSGIFSKIVSNIRLTSKKVRRSEALVNKLKIYCTASEVKFVKPILDVKTRWHSTYDMVNTAYQLRPALDMLWNKCHEVSNLRLDDEQWLCLEQVLIYLKNFKLVSKMLSFEQKVTLPSVVVAVNVLIDKIEKLIFELDSKKDRTKNDEILLLAFQASRNKILKHYKKCNWLYCVSLLLDPRHKKESFKATSWGQELEHETINKFENLFKSDYYDFSCEEQVPSKRQKNDDEIDFGDIYNMETDKCWRSEIDKYFNSPRADRDTDILQWWKFHFNVYPTLAKMARDILCVMGSSVPVERFFSTGSLIMTDRRTSLNDDSLKILMCINSWASSTLKEEICFS